MGINERKTEYYHYKIKLKRINTGLKMYINDMHSTHHNKMFGYFHNGCPRAFHGGGPLRVIEVKRIEV